MFVHNQLESHIKGEKLEEFKNLRIPAKGCKLSFSLDSRARALALLFDKGMEIPEDEVVKAKPAEEPEKAIDTEKDVELGLESAEDDDEPGVQLGTHTLLLVIEKGMQVFGDHAKLDWSRLPNYKWKPSKNKLQKFVRYLPIILNQIKEAIKELPQKLHQNQQTPEIDASIEKKQNERLTESAHRIAEIVKGDEKEELEGLDEEKAINENLSEIRKMKLHPADLLDSVRYKIHGAPAEFRNLSAEEYKMLVESMEKKILMKIQKRKNNCGKTKKNSLTKLAELTEFALYHGSDDGSKDFRVRLGAQALNSIINAKRFTKETGMALSASFLFTVGIAVGLDGFAWPWVADAVASIFHGNKEHYAVVVLTFLLDSFTALLAETLDSALVSRFLDSLKGGNLIPNSLKEYAVDIKEASKSGMVAMFGNTFSQASDLLATLRTKPFFIGEIQKQKNKSKEQQKYGKTAIPYGFILVISLITNQIAASTSAAVVPKEVKQTREYLVAELHNRYKSGFLSYPSELELDSIKSNEKLKEVEQGAEVARKLRIHNFIKETVTLSMKVSKSSATAINSMGVGSFISFAGFLTIDFVAHKLDWSNIVQKWLQSP
uniref:Uncharacterized protein n=1 Tax=Ditylenchus dipsaci TaxID=166011 RepID=A0A915EEJ9_9BILA